MLRGQTGMEWLDVLLFPLYFFLLTAIVFKIRNKYYPEGHPWRTYFTWAYYLKVLGSIFFCCVYQFYYKYGDTFHYFENGIRINKAFFDDFGAWVRLVTQTTGLAGDATLRKYTADIIWLTSPEEMRVNQITAFISLFTFNTYLNTSIIFAILSFSGSWALFRTFAKIRPELQGKIALATVFLPSVIVWGSGILKDSICMFGLGWLTYSAVEILVYRRFRLGLIFMMLMSMWLIKSMKIYILLAFLPALAFWLMSLYTQKLKNGFVRFLLSIMVIAVAFAGFSMVTSKFSEELGAYSLENVAVTSLTTRNYLERISESGDGSFYSLGKIDPSMMGFVKLMPAAINVSLFRPYPWEAGKLMMFLNSIEATLFLLLTLKLIFILGPLKVLKAIRSNSTIQFCLVFSLIFGFAVGVSSGNFGALSRYRIPMLPFYLLFLIFTYYQFKPTSKNFIIPWKF